MTKISIIYGTAREDYPLVNMSNVHQFKPFLDSLKRQTFKDFEAIIVDVLHDKRKFDFSEYNKEFLHPVKHLDPIEFSWARKKGLWGLQDQFNLGIIHADGELLLWFGDCGELVNEDSLQLWWDWYQKGYFAFALYRKDMVGHDDSRWKFIEDAERKTGIGIYHAYGSQFYGYSSSSLDSMLKINGFDSNFDGDKSLGDVEAGVRLERLGYKFICDKRLWLIERIHSAIPGDIFFGTLGTDSSDLSFRSNYSLMMLNQNKNKITVNDYKLTNDELEWIINHGIKWSVPRPEVGSHRYKLLMDWFNNPPIFNLRELRNERLKSEGKKEMFEGNV